jgi:hypothetical protein
MNSYTEFNDKERDLLLDILTERLESLREEVRHTDARAYKEGLKLDRAALQTLSSKICTPEEIPLVKKDKSNV